MFLWRTDENYHQILPSLSVSLTLWVAKDPKCLHVRLTDAQAGLSLYCKHLSSCWFCHASAYHDDPKFSDRQVLANSADPDQSAPRGAA